MVPIVTIDGPSGSGKGTISKSLALELGWNYLDSGLIYRCYAFLHSSKVNNIPNEPKHLLLEQLLLSCENDFLKF